MRRIVYIPTLESDASPRAKGTVNFTRVVDHSACPARSRFASAGPIWELDRFVVYGWSALWTNRVTDGPKPRSDSFDVFYSVCGDN